MVWPLIAMAAMSMMSQNKEAAGAALQAKERALDSVEQSKAIMEANTKNFQQTAFRVGLLNVQKAQEVRALEQRKFDASAQEQSVLGTAAVNAAASGTIGASVDAVQSDIQMAFDKVRAQINDENELNAQNYNTALYDLITEGQNQTVTSAQFRAAPKGASQLQMAGNAAIQVAGNYLMQRMDLGLGPKPGAVAGTRMTRG
ncbi:internal virion protein A [Pseudomonas phage Misse]|uniref:Internal virion protein A n=1 Tax=Pseudomonas phage Bertil TaxID=2801385 RepID=A0A7T8EQL5_9CAUD|nr:internal virion protein A [Pseudomonas phage Bertil]QQO90856.1 internal virion protein A [Pseudomonas phage Misse]QQO90907.1 internal virion protein A [Pseudomonas phage Strit]